jgi:hypothetical protein
VKQLQNTILHTDIPSDATTVGGCQRPIYISTLQIPVVYEAILDIVPGLHARPPILPESMPPDTLPLPKTSYDFMFHIGVAGRGPLRLERVGHKLGYHMKDATGKLADIVRSSPKDFSRRDNTNSLSFAAENAERERLGMDPMEAQTIVGGDSHRATRGFGSAYETFSDDITTDIDVSKLVQELRRSGVEVSGVLHPIQVRHQLIIFENSKYTRPWMLAITFVILSITALSPKPNERPSHTRNDEIPRFSSYTVHLLVNPSAPKKSSMLLNASSSGYVGNNNWSRIVRLLKEINR